MGRAKVVEINGRKYDAATGKLIKNTSNQTSGGSIDGVVKSKSAQQLHSTTKKTKTLNRSAVKKPETQETKKSASKKKAVHRSDQAKSQAHKVDEQRNKRAKTTARSSLISKFKKSSNQPAEEAKEPAATPSNDHKFVSSKYSPHKTNQEKKTDTDKKITKRFKSWSLKKPKARSVFATAVVVVLLIAYVTYLNIPNLSLRIAASRAGINATMPGYKPSGFSLAGPINYSEGIVTINFESNTDNRAFDVIERESSWDSQSLLANYVERETPNYVTFQDRGLTIYVYEGSHATWVDSGIWYTIEGESQLNSEQLLKIAASM